MAENNAPAHSPRLPRRAQSMRTSHFKRERMVRLPGRSLSPVVSTSRSPAPAAAAGIDTEMTTTAAPATKKKGSEPDSPAVAAAASQNATAAAMEGVAESRRTTRTTTTDATTSFARPTSALLVPAPLPQPPILQVPLDYDIKPPVATQTRPTTRTTLNRILRFTNRNNSAAVIATASAAVASSSDTLSPPIATATATDGTLHPPSASVSAPASPSRLDSPSRSSTLAWTQAVPYQQGSSRKIQQLIGLDIGVCVGGIGGSGSGGGNGGQETSRPSGEWAATAEISSPGRKKPSQPYASRLLLSPQDATGVSVSERTTTSSEALPATPLSIWSTSVYHSDDDEEEDSVNEEGEHRAGDDDVEDNGDETSQGGHEPTKRDGATETLLPPPSKLHLSRRPAQLERLSIPTEDSEHGAGDQGQMQTERREGDLLSPPTTSSGKPKRYSDSIMSMSPILEDPDDMINAVYLADIAVSIEYRQVGGGGGSGARSSSQYSHGTDDNSAHSGDYTGGEDDLYNDAAVAEPIKLCRRAQGKAFLKRGGRREEEYNYNDERDEENVESMRATAAFRLPPTRPHPPVSAEPAPPTTSTTSTASKDSAVTTAVEAAAMMPPPTAPNRWVAIPPPPRPRPPPPLHDNRHSHDSSNYDSSGDGSTTTAVMGWETAPPPVHWLPADLSTNAIVVAASAAAAKNRGGGGGGIGGEGGEMPTTTTTATTANRRHDSVMSMAGSTSSVGTKARKSMHMRSQSNSSTSSRAKRLLSPASSRFSFQMQRPGGSEVSSAVNAAAGSHPPLTPSFPRPATAAVGSTDIEAVTETEVVEPLSADAGFPRSVFDVDDDDRSKKFRRGHKLSGPGGAELRWSTLGLGRAMFRRSPSTASTATTGTTVATAEANTPTPSSTGPPGSPGGRHRSRLASARPSRPSLPSLSTAHSMPSLSSLPSLSATTSTLLSTAGHRVAEATRKTVAAGSGSSSGKAMAERERWRESVKARIRVIPEPRELSASIGRTMPVGVVSPPPPPPPPKTEGDLM